MFFICEANKKFEHIALNFIYVMMIFLSGLRSYTVGTDTHTYVSVFQLVANKGEYGEGGRFEPGYKWIVEAIAFFTDNYSFFLFVISLITFMGVYCFVKKNSKSPIMSTLIFYTMFFLNSMNISRQYLASAIAINSFTLAKERKYGKALLVILIATSIHKVAIVYLLVIVLALFKQDKRWLYFLSVGAILAIVIEEALVTILIHTFPAYKFYFEMSMYMSDGEIGKVTIIMILLTIWSIFVVSGIKLRRTTIAIRANDSVEKEGIYIASIMIGACFMGILGGRYAMFDRIAEMLNIFAILLIPYIIEKYRNRKYVLYVLMFGVMLLYMSIVISSGGIGVDPYVFCFQ